MAHERLSKDPLVIVFSFDGSDPQFGFIDAGPSHQRFGFRIKNLGANPLVVHYIDAQGNNMQKTVSTRSDFGGVHFCVPGVGAHLVPGDGGALISGSIEVYSMFEA